MARTSLAARLFLIAGLWVLIGGLPSWAEPVCPSDEIAHDTSGSIGHGATCNEALGNLSGQEWPKMSCPYGLFDYSFEHNNCVWTGSEYQATGWFTYYCQTDCHGD
jgi:hypothetical protein